MLFYDKGCRPHVRPAKDVSSLLAWYGFNEVYLLFKSKMHYRRPCPCTRFTQPSFFGFIRATSFSRLAIASRRCVGNLRSHRIGQNKSFLVYKRHSFRLRPDTGVHKQQSRYFTIVFDLVFTVGFVATFFTALTVVVSIRKACQLSGPQSIAANQFSLIMALVSFRVKGNSKH